MIPSWQFWLLYNKSTPHLNIRYTPEPVNSLFSLVDRGKYLGLGNHSTTWGLLSESKNDAVYQYV